MKEIPEAYIYPPAIRHARAPRGQDYLVSENVVLPALRKFAEENDLLREVVDSREAALDYLEEQVYLGLAIDEIFWKYDAPDPNTGLGGLLERLVEVALVKGAKYAHDSMFISDCVGEWENVMFRYPDEEEAAVMAAYRERAIQLLGKIEDRAEERFGPGLQADLVAMENFMEYVILNLDLWNDLPLETKTYYVELAGTEIEDVVEVELVGSRALVNLFWEHCNPN